MKNNFATKQSWTSGSKKDLWRGRNVKEGKQRQRQGLRKRQKHKRKDVVKIKSMEGRKKKEVATSNWKEIADMDYVRGVG